MGVTVLLIGDDALLGRALERALVADGFAVVRGGRSASKPAMVVLGPCEQGPGDSGVRPGCLADLDSLPLLVLDSGPVQAWVAGWRGPLAYLSQPFGSGQLIAAVREQIQRSAPPGGSVATLQSGRGVV